MDLADLLSPERICCQCNIKSKKRTLQTLAELLGESLRKSSEASANLLAEAHECNEPTESSGLRGASSMVSMISMKSRKQQPPKDGEQEADTLRDMDILDALIGRERLGSTGLGYGVGLPHSRLSYVQEPIAALITLQNGVDYDAADGQPVDLVLGLLVPEHCNDEHLKILAQLARRFSDESLRLALREFDNPSDLYTHINSLPPTAD